MECSQKVCSPRLNLNYAPEYIKDFKYNKKK